MFVVSDAGMTNLGEIAGESESVIIAFGFAPSEFVDCDQENMFELEPLALMGGHDLDGMSAITIRAGFDDGGGGGFVIIEHGDKVGKMGLGLVGVRNDGATESA